MENFDDLASAKSRRIEELLDYDIALPLVIDLLSSRGSTFSRGPECRARCTPELFR
jgi:hypothetical protein